MSNEQCSFADQPAIEHEGTLLQTGDCYTAVTMFTVHDEEAKTLGQLEVSVVIISETMSIAGDLRQRTIGNACNTLIIHTSTCRAFRTTISLINTRLNATTERRVYITVHSTQSIRVGT